MSIRQRAAEDVGCILPRAMIHIIWLLVHVCGHVMNFTVCFGLLQVVRWASSAPRSRVLSDAADWLQTNDSMIQGQQNHNRVFRHLRDLATGPMVGVASNASLRVSKADRADVLVMGSPPCASRLSAKRHLTHRLLNLIPGTLVERVEHPAGTARRPLMV